MKTRQAREICLRVVSWLPVGVCLALISWSYLVFIFSICRYLFTHDHVLQGMFYLVMITTIMVLLIWSYFLATFTSPGYPSEILQKYSGYNSAGHQEEAVNVGLLEPEQFYLSPAPSANNSPLVAGERRSVAVRDRTRQAVTTRQFGVERLSEDIDIADSTTLHPAHAHSDSWSQQTYPLSHDHHHPTASIHALPPLEPIRSKQQLHTIVDLSDDALDGRTVHENYGNEQVEGGGRGQSGYEGDEEDTEDNVPLGLSSTRRFTVKRDGKMRYCQKCKFEKPDRTHHCSSCKRCVLKMDHHCPWLNNCVGHKNYKAFYLFVLWTAIYCVVLVACTIPVAAEVISAPYSEDLFDPQWIFMILIGIIFGLCLVPFAIHHTLLIKANKTTIESFEKHKYRMGNRGEVMQSRLLNVFDLGLKQNFIQVLGPTWYLWLVPVRNSIGNGWSFPASDYGKSMLQMDDDFEPSRSSYDNNNSHSHGSYPPIPQRRDMPRHSISPLPHDHLYPQNQSNPGYSTSYNAAYDMEDSSYNNNNNSNMDDFDQEHHYRRDSDESDDDLPGGGGGRGGGSGRKYHQPTPRRFRQQGFIPTQQLSSDGEEPEEYLYDSDEPATIHFSNHHR